MDLLIPSDPVLLTTTSLQFICNGWKLWFVWQFLKTLTMEEAKKTLEGIDNVMLFDDEGKMIDTFPTLIEDADILSGWNSEGYDIPTQ